MTRKSDPDYWYDPNDKTAAMLRQIRDAGEYRRSDPPGRATSPFWDMSDNATLVERLRAYVNPLMREAALRIAELEAERDALAKTVEEAVADAAYWKRQATRNLP